MTPILRLLEEIARFTLFTGKFFRKVLAPPYEWQELANQMQEIGTKSLLLVAAAGVAIGMVLAMQTSSTLERFGGEALLPSMIAVAVLREIGPIITGLVVAGRVGAGIGAELGSMRVTEQIDAMEVGALDPYQYLVTTRVLACILMLPILTIYADALALAGGYVAMALERPISLRLYLNSAVRYLRFDLVFPAVVKTAVFGFIIGSISSYAGYHASGGTRGVGRAAMVSVVMASLLIILADVVLVKLTIFFFG